MTTVGGAPGHATRERALIQRTTLDLSPCPTWVFDAVTLRFLAVNQVAIRFYGFSEADFLSMSILEIHSPAEAGRLDECAGAGEPPQAMNGIWRHRTKNGSEIEADLFVQDLPLWSRNARLAQARDVTIERRAIRALEASERRFRDLFEHSTGFICIHNFDGILLAVNQAAAAAVGRGVGDLLGTPLHHLSAPERRHLIDAYLQRIVRDGEDAGYLRVQDRNGADLVWQYRNRVYADADGSSCVIAHAQDVTAMRAVERALQLSEQRLRTIADTLPVKVAYIDMQQRFVFANEAYRRSYGGSADEVAGRHLREVLGEERYAQRAPFVERALNGERVVFEDESGEGDDYRCVEATLIPELADDGVSVIGVHAMMQDVSSKKREEHRLIRLARIDSLTGLLNRAGFNERFENAIARSRDQGSLLALFYLDIDRFKQVNDTHGHVVGDALIRVFATQLAAKVRASDVVARLGGDEFCIVMEGVPDVPHVEAIAAKLVSAMNREFELRSEGVSLPVGVSIGIALCRAAPLTATELVARADAMLYEAKQAGRGTYRLALIGDQAALRRDGQRP
ncbi:diguanylate cyclase [Dokdonella soli]